MLELAHSKELRFTREEISMVPERWRCNFHPHSLFLEKPLEGMSFRTANAMELWRDLHTPQAPAQISGILPVKE